ncbi:MAG: DNA polymerase III subunit beta [Rickettsiales bacterium]
MQFEVQKSVLLKAIADTNGAVEKRNTIEILQNIKIDVADDKVILTATDMDILISSEFACDMKSSGKTTVPAQMFFDIIRKIPDGAVLLKLENNTNLQIKSGRSKFSLPCIDAEEYPSLAEGEFSNFLEIEGAKFAKIIDQSRFAISLDESRYYLNGLYFQAYKSDQVNQIRAVATDGHRLALSFFDAEISETFAVIIPRKSVNEIRRIIEGVKNIKVAISRTKIKITADKSMILSKLIDGEYPDYQKVIPKNNSAIALIPKKPLFDCVDRVATMAMDKHKSIKVILENGKISFQIGSDENVIAFEEMEVNYSGERIETGFNAKYFLDIISHIENEEIIIRFRDSMAPALIEAKDLNSVFVIMPVRV